MQLEIEKFFPVVRAIAQQPAASQRDLSRATGHSLGLINHVIRRLIQDGYLEASQINKRRVEYRLTEKGLDAVRKHTRELAEKTIRGFRSLTAALNDLLEKLETQGYRYFSIRGDGQLSEMMRETFRRRQRANATLGIDHRESPEAVVLNVAPSPMPPEFKGTSVHVIEEIHQSL